jgi:hypothetical protein
MRIEYKIVRRRGSGSKTFSLEPPDNQSARAPRVARLVALAHKLESLVQKGEVRDYGELARLGRISPARLSQILLLAQLAPVIQERILFLPAWEDGVISELELRETIAREIRWDRQVQRFNTRVNPS